MDFLKLILKAFTKPSRIIPKIRNIYAHRFGSPKMLASVLYEEQFGEKINWKKPYDLNQWINYVSFKGDSSQWPILADKVRVRDIIIDKGFQDNLPRIYKIWGNADDLDWTDLPDSFVLKMNNGSGDCTIIRDKKIFSLDQVKQKYQSLFYKKYGEKTGEKHYAKIKPLLFAEELLDIENQAIESSSLIDYKIWCFNGVPYYCCVFLNRTENNVDIDLYTADSAWLNVSHFLNYNSHFKKNHKPIPVPNSLEKMLLISRTLSEGHPQMRIDFYEVGGYCYIGEITMTSYCGRMKYFTREFLKKTGDIISKGNL